MDQSMNDEIEDENVRRYLAWRQEQDFSEPEEVDDGPAHGGCIVGDWCPRCELDRANGEVAGL